MAFDLPPQNSPARNACILGHIQAKDYEAPWCVVPCISPLGRQINLELMADALKIGGVRVNVSATLAQQIADLTGCLLLTPKMADLLYLFAKARGPVLYPSPQLITASTQAMQEHSARVDAALSRVQLPPVAEGAPPVQTVGKHWVVANELESHPGRAENYGWHVPTPGTNWSGINLEPAVTPGLRVIQGQGWAHDPSHVDYSQILQLAHGRCTVDGQDRDLREALQDPDLSAALNHNGPLRVLRQPGVDVMRQTQEPGSAQGARSFLRRWGAPVAGAVAGFAIGGPPGAMVGAGLGVGAEWGVDTYQRRRA